MTSSSARLRISDTTTRILTPSTDNRIRSHALEERSPAQIYSLVIGAVLVLSGIAGFFYNASFGSGDGTERDALLGILDVNGWHNVVHIVTGAIGLAAAGSYGASRGYAIGL